MKTLNFLKLFVFLTLSATLFNSCTKEPIANPIEVDDYAEILSVTEANLSDADLEFISLINPDGNSGTDLETATTRNAPPCDIEVCATFTGNGKYRVILPNGTLILVSLNNQTVTINGNTFPLINNQLCQTISVPGSSTANLGFKGTGSVVVTASYPNGTSAIIFQAGVGNPNQVVVVQDVTLDCPVIGPTCDIEICATFTGNGKYRVILPNGTLILVSLNNQTVTINGNTFPLINNQLCQVVTFNGPETANLGFKGTGSVVVTAEWPDGTVCNIFEAGVGNPNQVILIEDVTLDCDPPC